MEKLNKAAISDIAELKKHISHTEELSRNIVKTLIEAESKLSEAGEEWVVLHMPDKPDLSLTDSQLIPLLQAREEQIFEIKKADIAKIKKLEEALAKLKSGEECYYVITKLSSIKSLCQNAAVRQHYYWYLFDCVKRQLEAKVNEAHQQTPKEQFIFNLVYEIAQVMADMQEGKEVSDALHKYRSQLAHYQSDYNKDQMDNGSFD